MTTKEIVVKLARADKATLEKIAKVLTTRGRKQIKKKNFGMPASAAKSGKGQKGSYPIYDIEHARNALARGAQHLSEDEYAKLRTRVYAKYPSLKNNKEDKTAGRTGLMKNEEVIEKMSNANMDTLMKISNILEAKKEAGEIPGVPDATGPHGRGAGPGKGKADGTGLKKLEEEEEDKEEKEEGSKKEALYRKVASLTRSEVIKVAVRVIKKAQGYSQLGGVHFGAGTNRQEGLEAALGPSNRSAVPATPPVATPVSGSTLQNIMGFADPAGKARQSFLSPQTIQKMPQKLRGMAFGQTK